MYPLEGGAKKKTSSPEKRRSRSPEDGLRVVYLGVEVTEDGERGTTRDSEPEAESPGGVSSSSC